MTDMRKNIPSPLAAALARGLSPLVLTTMLLFAGCVLPREKLHVNVRDQDGRPIKGAAVSVYQRRPVSMLNFWSDGWDHSTAETDAQGEATVSFNARTSHFEWSVAAEGYHFAMETTSESLSVTNNVEGNDYTITEHELSRSVTLWKKRNPKPMYGYTNPLGTAVEVPDGDGRWGFDLQKCDWVAPLGRGKVADFYITCKSEITDSYRDYTGYIEIPNQGGAYKGKKNDSTIFPSVYEADLKANYLSRLPYHYRFDSHDKQIIDESIIKEDEYLVLKTRVQHDKDGHVISANYSKILGEFGVGGFLLFQEIVFNPTPNDNNLERDWKASAVGPHGTGYTHP